MLLQLETDRLTTDALVALAKGTSEVNILRQLTEIATEDINKAIIYNPDAPKELRQEIFESVNYCEDGKKYLECLAKSELNHDTISLILANFPDCIYRYGELLDQEEATIEDLNVLFEGIIRNKYEVRYLLTKMIRHNNVDAALLTKIADVSDELRERVIQREGVSITIHFNKEEE